MQIDFKENLIVFCIKEHVFQFSIKKMKLFYTHYK